MYTAELNFSKFVIEYISEIETEFENALACLSGAQIGSNHEKMEVKNLVTHFLFLNSLDTVSLRYWTVNNMSVMSHDSCIDDM